MWAAHVGLKRWTTAHEDAAQTSGLRRAGHAWLRWRCAVTPSITALLLVALLVIGEFALPDLYGVRTLSAEVFAAFAAYSDPVAALRPMIPIALMAAVLLGFLMITGRSWDMSATAPSTAESLRAPSTHRYGISMALAAIATVVVFLVPSMALTTPLWRSAPSAWQTIVLAASMVRSDWAGTLLIGVTVAVVVGLFAPLIAQSAIRPSKRFHSSGRLLAMLALVSPASVWGLGWVVLARSDMGVRFSALALLCLALAVRYLVVASEILGIAFKSIHPQQEEAAAASGMRFWSMWRTIYVRPSISTWCVAAALVGCLASSDVGLSILLSPPGFSTLMVRIYQTVHYGPPALLSAMVVIQVGTIAAGALVMVLLGKLVFRRRAA